MFCLKENNKYSFVILNFYLVRYVWRTISTQKLFEINKSHIEVFNIIFNIICIKILLRYD